MSSASSSRNPGDTDGVSYRGKNSSSETKQPANDKPEETDTTGSFECNICLDTAKNAVVSMCGHLFCWPCLHQWLETREMRPSCPVCKSAISKSKVIPLYGRGADSSQDPRTKVPPRPQGRRTEPENQSWTPFGGGFANFFGRNEDAATPGMTNFAQGSFRMSVGIGAFPFGLFATFPWFNDNQANNSGSSENGQAVANVDAEWISKLFLCVAIFFLFLLIIA